MIRRWMLSCLFLVWWPSVVRADDAPKPESLPRVLLLGDSISLGYTDVVRKNLQGQAEVLRPNENCQHSAHGVARIKTWLGSGKWDAIHFNFGIWDTHMLDANSGLIRNEANFAGAMHIRHTPEQYRANLLKIVTALEATGAKLIWASTTPIMSRSGARFETIAEYNRVAAELMNSRGVAINDLYAAVLPKAADWQSGDKVHFHAQGNVQLGKLVSDRILESLRTDVRHDAEGSVIRKTPGNVK